MRMNRIRRFFLKDLKLKIIALLITLYVFLLHKAADENRSEEITLEKGVEE